jgi:hypothetical protein
MDSLESIINARLLRLFGKEQLSGQQKYRIVRSEFQTEKRYGSYDILTQETGIWLGAKQGLVEIKKYWYMKDCWLLERVEPNIDRKDIFHDKFTYEPLFPFLDKDDNQLPLNWKAIEFLVNRVEKAEKRFLTEEEHRLQEEKKQQEESDKVYGLLDAPESTKPLPSFESSTLLTGSNKSKVISLR